MKPLRSLALGSLLGASLCLAGSAPAADEKPKAKPAEASAQHARTAAAHKSVSPADQKAIIALFKDVDPAKYRLEFNHGKTVAGSRKVSMQELEQTKTVTNPGESHGAVMLAVRDDGVMFVFAVTKNDELNAALGAEKMAKLNAIMTKYNRPVM